MTEVICEIRCTDCQRWFMSPIQFGDAGSYFNSTLRGNRAKCPHCQSIVPINKENMRFSERREDGGVTYTEGRDAI
jgi:hypothetical protein